MSDLGARSDPATALQDLHVTTGDENGDAEPIAGEFRIVIFVCLSRCCVYREHQHVVSDK